MYGYWQVIKQRKTWRKRGGGCPCKPAAFGAAWGPSFCSWLGSPDFEKIVVVVAWLS